MSRYRNGIKTIGASIAIVSCLSACGGKQVGATVTGLNYRDDEIRFFITDPENDKNGAGGEDFLPYSVGGQLCCYSLPAKWHKGLQVKLDVETAGGVMKDGGGKEAFEADREERRKAGTLYQSTLLEISEYHTQSAPTLWVQFLPGDRYAAIVSDVGPRDDAWPGEVKGWPEPTLAYQQKLWSRKVKEIEGSLETARQRIEESKNKYSEDTLKDEWKFWIKYDKDALSNIASYQDPAFTEYLKKRAYEFRSRYEQLLTALKSEEPQ